MEPELPIARFEVFAQGLDHPEGVAFDPDGYLWAGGEAGQIYRIDPKGRVELVTGTGGFSGGIAVAPGSGDVFVCNPAHGVVRVDRAGRWSVFARRAGDHPLHEANFPLFDRAGRLYVSDSGHWRQTDGYIARFDPGGEGEIVAGPFSYANGMALSADERTLFLAETDTSTVYRIPIDAVGRLGEAEVLASPVGRLPDGLALDQAGDLYVSCYASDDIYRIPAGGSPRRFAHDPEGILLRSPTNLAFRGPHLYVANLGRQVITRARVDCPGQPLAGSSRS